MSNRTITLTGRPPVTIDEENWPVIAEAQDDWWDGKVECQSNRWSDWTIRVRQHADGRSIIYATYSYRTNWQNARGYAAKRGRLIAASDDICAAIRAVCDEMASAEAEGDDAGRWAALEADCIADLPAEKLT